VSRTASNPVSRVAVRGHGRDTDHPAPGLPATPGAHAVPTNAIESMIEIYREHCKNVQC
jgi:hypothetical protein